jgi:hypothetical protein
MNNLKTLKENCEKISKKIKQNGEENNSHYVIDGIIDTEKYLASKYRILWILKDPNSDETWSYLEKFKDKEWLKRCGKSIPTLRRIIYITYGILRDAIWEKIPDAKDEKSFEPLQEIALINIKKTPGGGSVADESIQDAYNKDSKLLKHQIETYDPDIIILGNTLQYFNANDFKNLENTVRQISDFGNHYYDTGEKLYIHTWHPAARGKGFTDKGYIMDIVDIVKSWKKERS